MGKSQLFGDMPISSRWEASNGVAEEDYVPFPWQLFVQQAANGEVTVEEVPDAAVPEEPKAEEPKPAEEPAEDPNEEFTLKKGTKRKSDAVEK